MFRSESQPVPAPKAETPQTSENPQRPASPARRRRSLLVIAPVMLVGFYLGTRIPVQAHVQNFVLNKLPLNKVLWVASKGTGICGLRDAWAGYSEWVDTKKSSEWAAANSRLRRVDAAGLQEWESPAGVFWFPKGAEAWTVHFALGQFRTGAYPGAPVRQGDIVIDCGGYVGDWTKWALKAGASRAVTVEPASSSIERIRRNLAAEIREGKVTLVAKGVWDRQDTLHLNLDEANPAANSVTAAQTAKSETIELTTIDEIVEALRLERVDYIKIDVEGAETRAIRGARRTLNRFHPRLAIATEHTNDVFANNRNVVEAVREAAPFYRMECGYCLPSKHETLPVTLYFMP